MTRYLLDTNVILRFLKQDDPEQSPRATALFQSAADGACLLRLKWEVLAETIWVLRTGYDQPHESISNTLTTLIQQPSVECDRPVIVIDALARYGSSKLDIVDCLLAAEAVATADALASFDRQIPKRFPDVNVWDHDSTAG